MAQAKYGLTPEQASFVASYLPNCALKEELQAFSDNYPAALNEKIYRFLEKNGLSTAWIPEIKELGEHKRGFALVKEINEAGGMKKVRRRYAHFVVAKARSRQ